MFLCPATPVPKICLVLSIPVLVYIFQFDQVMSRSGQVSEEAARRENISMKKPRSRKVQPKLNSIWQKLHNTKTNQRNFKKTLTIGNPKLNRFFMESHHLNLNMNKVLDKTAREVWKTNINSRPGNKNKNKKIGTVIYNRINKSGSATLLSRQF